MAHIGLSPQSQIADQIKQRRVLTDESKLTQWETVMTELLDAIVRQPDIDPILQVALLRKVIEAAMEGSEPLRHSLESFKNQLDQSNVDVNVPWMDPEVDLERNRDAAAAVVQSLPSLADAGKKALARRDVIERSVAGTYRTVGWLAQDRDGWRVRTGAVFPDNKDLWVIAMREDKHAEWRKVGTIAGSQPKIDTRDNSTLVEGRPVFVMSSF